MPVRCKDKVVDVGLEKRLETRNNDRRSFIDFIIVVHENILFGIHHVDQWCDTYAKTDQTAYDCV